MERWLLGMLLTFLGCNCSAVGLILIKHSTAVEGHLPLHRKRYWALGFLFLIVNASLIDVFAFSLAPITLIAPFAGVTIVLTSYLASTGLVFVKEQLDRKDTQSTAITVAGVLITSVYGPHVDEQPVDSDTLYGYFFAQDFLDCITGLATLLGFLWILHVMQALRARAAQVALYALTAAMAGSMSMLLIKVVGTALLAYIERGEPLVTKGWLLSLAALGCCAATQMGFLHHTLANSPVSYGVPAYQALLTVLTIITGGIFFSEFGQMSSWNEVVFGFGACVTLLGLAVHSVRM
jgi:drug/metabolite transporter (DMT)-like permease